MRRAFYSPRIEEAEGSQRSQELATALAMTSDPEFLEAVLHLKSLLDRIGGQAYIVSFRNKYDPATGELLEDARKPGRYVTEGYAFHYEHIAKLSNAPREPDPRLDDVVEVRDNEGWELSEAPEGDDGADAESDAG